PGCASLSRRASGPRSSTRSARRPAVPASSAIRGRSRMSRSRSRPRRLESRAGPQALAAPPTLQEELERSHVTGHGAAPGPSELRRLVERAAAEREPPVLLDDAWAEVEQ